MLADQHTIVQYLPQRNPILMVHNLLEVSDQHAVSELLLSPDNIFISAGVFTEPGLVENIAQTAAAHAGYYFTQQEMTVPLGFIAAIKDLKIFSLPPINDVIRTTIRITNKVLDVTIVNGEIEWQGTVICSCEMRIFTKPQQL